jgi:hypothetical protein
VTINLKKKVAGKHLAAVGSCRPILNYAYNVNRLQVKKGHATGSVDANGMEKFAPRQNVQNIP